MPLSKYERKEKLGYGAAAKIARQIKRSEGHVSQVINGKRRDPAVEAAIARRIGLPIEEVFPTCDNLGSATQAGV